MGDRTTCPVSQEVFVISPSSPTVRHEQQVFYFCKQECADAFRADPAKYWKR